MKSSSSPRALRYQVLAIVCFVQVLLQLVLLGALAVAQDNPGIPLTLLYDTWTGRSSPGTLNVGKSGTTTTVIQSADKTGGGTLIVKEDATNGVVSLMAKDGSGNPQTLFGCSAGQCAFGDTTNGSLLSSPTGTIAEMRAPSGACGRLSGNGGVVGTGTLIDACPGGLVLSKGATISAAIVPVSGGGLDLPSLTIAGGQNITFEKLGSIVFDFGAITSPNCLITSTITVTGAAAGDPCTVGVPNGPSGSSYTCECTSANTCDVRECCTFAASTCDAASQTYKILVRH